LLVALVAMLPVSMAWAAEMKLAFPQNRKTFQTNEMIDVSVVRTGEGALPAGNVTLVLTGENSKMTFVFGLQAGAGSATDNLHLNGWMIKPGSYTLTAAMGDLKAEAASFDVFSHVRKSTYKTIHWGGPRDDAGMTGEGENGLGYNIMMGGVTEQSIREGMDIMGSCTMGGGHQHDLVLDNDWSDPYVTIGAIQRGMDVTMAFRTMPNFIGSHLHDEPGLTWNDHPFLKDENGKAKMSPHDIASQRRAYQSAFDKEQTWVQEINTKTAEGLADWTQINDFKLGYMSAFWKASRDAVERIKPGALAVTQSQYGWTALYDGYYFNVVASMPIVSGHGGYNDFWLMNFNSTFFLEMALPRQLDKPTWYLPGWYDCTADVYRLEQYMSFVTGIQGLAFPPGINKNSKAAPAVKETNHVAARLGTIFTTPNYTRQDVAVLYSKSDSYFHMEVRQPAYLTLVYMATKLLQQPINVVVEEDILDGTVAESHKVIIVAGVEYLAPAVVDALADFAKNGGKVIVGDESKVNIPGATKLGMAIPNYSAESWTKFQAATKDLPAGEEGAKIRNEKHAELLGFMAWVNQAKPVAEALKKQLAAAKVAPAFVSDSPFIAPGRQVRGEIEYIFAVNFTMANEKVSVGNPAKATATITLADDGRATYDAMASKEVALNKGAVKVDFGPGDMKVFARTARPIGGVLVFAPVFNTDLTREGAAPISMTFSAALVDKANKAISGTAPLQIVVKDPAGKVRYDLFRATESGVCSVTLPMAANDAAGKWTVEVTDLLAGTKGSANFEFKPMTRARALAGATHRAVFFGDDKANIYRFFRDHRNVTIAIGDSDYNRAAAERLVKILKPYNVTCDIVVAKDVLGRELTAEEARTWCGTSVAGRQPAGRGNPAVIGWDLKNPTIVLGTPEDNVMIRHLANPGRNMLPYRPSATFPGKGNGMLAWNIQALGHDVHSVACIAYDAEGMSQAVGTLFEIVAGLDPLFPLALPSSATIEMTK